MAIFKHTRFSASKKLKHSTLLKNYAACIGVSKKTSECKKARGSSLYKYLMMFALFYTIEENITLKKYTMVMA